MSDNRITVALVGNPNSGKTTLFNGLTGSNHRIGNWPGVTVEKKEGICKLGDVEVNVVDLPGIYSFSLAGSEDERIASHYLMNEKPDVVLNIIDSTNLARNLYLTSQLIEMEVPVVCALNRMDAAEKKNISIDIEGLSEKLGCEVIDLSAIKKKEVKKFKETLSEKLGTITPSVSKIHYPQKMEKLISSLGSLISAAANNLRIPSRWSAIRILEGDKEVHSEFFESDSVALRGVQESVRVAENELSESLDVIAADSRYRFIGEAVSENITTGEGRVSISEKIDNFVTGRFTGIPIFLGVMYLMFWFAVTVGGSFIDFFDIAFGTVFVDGFAHLLESIGSPQWLTVLLSGGVGAGIQTVATFVPVVFSMFFALSILEDSGYMARAAFVMDRVMRSIGLPGKSFVPMLVGFGCTVPAIMGTRTLDSKRDRFMTIFMAPFMSCGARLPVYALFGAVFFGANAGLMVFAIYLTGIVLAVLTGLLLKNTLFKGEPSFFIMELPDYNYPRLGSIMRNTWSRLKLFVLRAGKVIVAVVMVLSLLNSVGKDGSFGNEDSENSVLSSIGKTITPIFEPMGITEKNWPVTVSIFTGIFAKEVIVGTLNSIYTQIDQNKKEAMKTEGGEVKEAAEEPFSVKAGLVEALNTIPENLSGIFGGLTDPLGVEVIKTASTDKNAIVEELEVEAGIFDTMKANFPGGALQVFPFLLFVLIYFPCVAAFGAMVQETGKKLGIIIVTYLTLLGWIISTLFYQLTLGYDPVWIIVPLIMLAGIIAFFKYLGKKDEVMSAEE